MASPTTSGTKRRCSASFHLEAPAPKRQCTDPLRLETSDSADLRKLDTESDAPTTTCWLDVEEDAPTTNDGGQCARIEEVSDNGDLAIVGRGKMTCLPDQTLGIVAEEARGAHSSVLSPVFDSKQDAVQNANHCLPNGTFELQASSTAKIDHPWKIGNTYSHVQVLGKARVHMGDSYTVNNHYSGSVTAEEGHTLGRIEINEELVMTFSAVVVLARTFLQTCTGLLVLLQFVMSIDRLPKRISIQLAFFEDALGRPQEIDLLYTVSWSVFQQRLENDFRGTPGSRRVHSMKGSSALVRASTSQDLKHGHGMPPRASSQ
jgi:hypothetical protein